MWNKIGRAIILNGFYIVFFCVIVFFSLKAENFPTLLNLNAILFQSAPLVIIATGLTFVIITGSLDISVGSIAFVSSAAAMFVYQLWNIKTIWCVLIVITVATLCGLVNGLLIVKLKINPLIVTMGMMISLRGLALFITKGNQITVPKSIYDFGGAKIAAVYLEVILAISILIIAQIILSKTHLGKYIIATGCDAGAAKAVGIKVDIIRIIVFILSGFFAGIAGILMMGQSGVVHTSMGQGMEFTAIAVIVIGGTSLFGGKGSLIPGTLFGTIILILIENGLNYMGISPYFYPFVRGLIIFIAMFIDSFKYRLKTIERIYG